MLENEFHDTNAMVPRCTIIAGSIDAQEFFIRKKDFPYGAGCFLGCSVLLVELIRFPLCLGLFFCLQAHVGMKHMQENDFIKAWCHHSIIAASIYAQQVFK